MVKHYSLSFCIFLLTFQAFSQTCCSGGVPVSANLGLPTSDKGSWQFNLSYDHNVLRTLKDENTRLDDQARERITRSLLFELGYVFSKHFSIDVFISYVIQERTIRQFGAENLTRTRGLGDIVLLFKYQPINTSTTHLLLGIGPKIPTGQSDIGNIIADLQPGSGAWDGILWSSFRQQMRFRPTMNLNSTLTYSIKGTNNTYLQTQTYQFGQELQWITGLSDRFTLGKYQIDPSISFRFRYVEQDKQNDFKLPNTGGQWLFLMPGLVFNLSPNLALSTNAEIPLFAQVTGTQLSPSFRLNTGVYFKISPKPKIFNITN